jgi:hypothetical protein
VDFGCQRNDNTSTCLYPYTMYVVEVSVVREQGSDAAKRLYVATLQTSREIVRENVSSVHLHGGVINVTFVEDVPVYGKGTPIAQTLLGAATALFFPSGTRSLPLGVCTVESLSSRLLQIRLPEWYYATIIPPLWAPTFRSSAAYLAYGAGETMKMRVYG